jgi:hypothetical protein
LSRIQWDKIQKFIRMGIEEGATLVAGGPGLFSDDTSTSCDTAFAKIWARV